MKKHIFKNKIKKLEKNSFWTFYRKRDASLFVKEKYLNNYTFIFINYLGKFN